MRKDALRLLRRIAARSYPPRYSSHDRAGDSKPGQCQETTAIRADESLWPFPRYKPGCTTKLVIPIPQTIHLSGRANPAFTGWLAAPERRGIAECDPSRSRRRLFLQRDYGGEGGPISERWSSIERNVPQDVRNQYSVRLSFDRAVMRNGPYLTLSTCHFFGGTRFGRLWTHPQVFRRHPSAIAIRERSKRGDGCKRNRLEIKARRNVSGLCLFNPRYPSAVCAMP